MLFAFLYRFIAPWRSDLCQIKVVAQVLSWIVMVTIKRFMNCFLNGFGLCDEDS